MTFELEREQTVQALCQQFAHDQLSTQELEKRLEAAYRATSPEELRALVAALPALPVGAPGAAVPAMLPVRTVPGREQRVLAAFGAVRKRGDWEPSEHTRGVAVFGELELDFRDARIPLGVTHIRVAAAFGSVRIIVPPGIHVECDGSAVMGQFTERTSLSADPGAEAPTVRVTGVAVFGGVKVLMRLPGETPLQAYRRERGR